MVDVHKTIRWQTFIEKSLASPKYIFKDDSQENISQDIVFLQVQEKKVMHVNT